ncbi:hypothetical protein [Luteimonas changyuni]|uniref:hypothetical protein n=1 Tax=Luteimonas sp. MJ145 TaxID=3129234 RepID=UPI0031BA6CA7
MDTKRLAHLIPLAAALALASAAIAGEPSAEAGQATSSDVETMVQAEVAVRGSVTAIDVEKRLVTLDTGTGTRVLPVDPRVTGIDELRVGDVVDVRYHRSVLFDIQPGGSAEPGAYISEGLHPSNGGQVGEQEVTVLAAVVEVDAASGAFTVQGPSGNVRTLHAETPEHREAVGRIKVGDLLRVRFREGLAVSVAQAELH